MNWWKMPGSLKWSHWTTLNWQLSAPVCFQPNAMGQVEKICRDNNEAIFSRAIWYRIQDNHAVSPTSIPTPLGNVPAINQQATLITNIKSGWIYDPVTKIVLDEYPTSRALSYSSSGINPALSPVPWLGERTQWWMQEKSGNNMQSEFCLIDQGNKGLLCKRHGSIPYRAQKGSNGQLDWSREIWNQNKVLILNWPAAHVTIWPSSMKSMAILMAIAGPRKDTKITVTAFRFAMWIFESRNQRGPREEPEWIQQ